MVIKVKHGFLDLKEAVLKDPELGEKHWNKLVEGAAKHPIIKRALAEGLHSDVAAALGGMQTVVQDALYPKQLARELLTVIATTKTMERFYKGLRGYTFNNEGKPYATGPKTTYQDIGVNITRTAKQEWNQDFAEDIPWDIMAFEARNMGKEIGRDETADAIALFNAITTTDLAGAAEVTITNGAPTWVQIIDLIAALMAHDDYPTVIALNPDEFTNLLTLDQFINALYADHQNWRDGVVLHTQLGIKFISCSQITKTLAVNTDRAGVLLLRQDMMTVPWEDEGNFKYGISARERYGMGILWTTSVARGTY